MTMGKIKQLLGENIRNLRLNKGWTQVYLADRLQITAPFLAQIESGKRGTSLETIEDIADIFSIPIASLFLEDRQEQKTAGAKVFELCLTEIEQQLRENISQSISNAFSKLK